MLKISFLQGLSAIQLAALDCQLECLKVLIEKMSIDVNHKSPDGWTCLHLVINHLMPERSLACVEYLLSCGADPSRCAFSLLYVDTLTSQSTTLDNWNFPTLFKVPLAVKRSFPILFKRNAAMYTINPRKKPRPRNTTSNKPLKYIFCDLDPTTETSLHGG